MVKSPPPSAADQPPAGGPSSESRESLPAAASLAGESRRGALDLDEKALDRLPPHLQRTLRYALEQPPQDVPPMQLARSLEE